MTDHAKWFKAASLGDTAFISAHLEEYKGSTNEQKETAMMVATRAGHEAVVRILLNYEALYVNSAGDTALVLAARQNNATICRLLATRERTILTAMNRDACTEAVLAEAYQAFEALYEQTELSSDQNGMSVLDYASRMKDPKYLKALLSRTNLAQGYVSNTLALALNEGNTPAARLLEAYIAKPKSFSPSRKVSASAEPMSPKINYEEGSSRSMSPHMHAMPILSATDANIGVRIPVTIPSSTNPIVVDPPSILTTVAVPTSLPAELSYTSVHNDSASRVNELRIQLFNRLSAEGLTHISDETIVFLEDICDQAAKAQLYRDQLEEEMHHFEQDRLNLLQQIDELQLLVSQYNEDDNIRPAVDCSAAQVQFHNPHGLDYQIGIIQSPEKAESKSKTQQFREALKLSNRKLSIRKAEMTTYKAMVDITMHNLGPLLDAYGFLSAVSLQPLSKSLRELERYIDGAHTSSERIEDVIPTLIKKGTSCLEGLNEVFLSILESIPNSSDPAFMELHKKSIIKSLSVDLSTISSPSSSSHRLLSPQTASPPARLQLSTYTSNKRGNISDKVLVSKINPVSMGLTVTDLRNDNDQDESQIERVSSFTLKAEPPGTHSVNIGTSGSFTGYRTSASQRDEEPCMECQSLRIQLAKVRNDHIMIQNEYMTLESAFNDIKKSSTNEINDLIDKLSSSSEAIQKLDNEIASLRKVWNQDQATIATLQMQLTEKQQELEELQTDGEISKGKIESLTSRLTLLNNTLNTQASFDANNGSFNTRMSQTMRHDAVASKDDFFSLISMNVGSRRESDAVEMQEQAFSTEPKYIDSATSPARAPPIIDSLDSDSALKFATINPARELAPPHKLNTSVSRTETNQTLSTLDTMRGSEDRTEVVTTAAHPIPSPQQLVLSRSRSRIKEVIPRVPTVPPRSSIRIEELEQENTQLLERLKRASVAEETVFEKLKNILAFSQRTAIQQGCFQVDASVLSADAALDEIAEAILGNIKSLDNRLSTQSLYPLCVEELTTIYTELKVANFIAVSPDNEEISNLVRSKGLSTAILNLLQKFAASAKELENKNHILNEISTGMSDLDAIVSSQQKTIEDNKAQIEDYRAKLSSNENVLAEFEQYIKNLEALIQSIDIDKSQPSDMLNFSTAAPKLCISLSKTLEAHLLRCNVENQSAQDEIARLKSSLERKEIELTDLSMTLDKSSETVKTLKTELATLREAEEKAKAQTEQTSNLLQEARKTIIELEHQIITPPSPGIEKERAAQEAKEAVEHQYKTLIRAITSSAAFSKNITPKSVQLFQETKGSDSDSLKLLASVFDELSVVATTSSKALTDMRRELREKTEDLEAIDEEIVHKNVRIQKLEAEVRQKAEQISILEEEKITVPKLDKDLYVEKELYAALETQILGFNKELAASTQLVTQFKIQLASKEELITSLQARNSTLLAAKTDAEALSSEQRVQLSELELQLASAKHDASYLKTLLEDMKLDLENSKNELDLRKKEIMSTKRNAEKIIGETHESLAHAESRIMVLTKELREVQAEIGEKEEEIARLHTKLREQKVSIARQSIDSTNLASSAADIAELTKANNELNMQLKMALDDLNEKTSECSRKTKLAENLELNVKELHERIELLTTEKSNIETRLNQRLNSLTERNNELLAQCNLLKDVFSKSNTTNYNKFETVAKKLLIFSMHVQQLISLHHTFIQEQMAHKTEIENLRRQETMLRNLRIQDSNSISMLNSELADAKRQYAAQLEHKNNELSSLREQVSCISNDRNELALSFAALKESLQKVESPSPKLQNIENAEANTIKSPEIATIGTMLSPIKMMNASVTACNTEEMDQLKIRLQMLQEELQTLQTAQEELVKEKQTLLQQNIIYREELFTTHVLITNKIDPGNKQPSPEQDYSVIALVQQMLAKIHQLENVVHTNANSPISSSIDAPAVDVSMCNKSNRDNVPQSPAKTEPGFSLEILAVIIQTLAGKLVEIIELTRIIENKSRQIDWIADEALRAHLTGADLRDRAKILQLSRSKGDKVDMGPHKNTILVLRDNILKGILPMLSETGIDDNLFQNMFSRVIETSSEDLYRNLKTNVRIVVDTRDFSMCTINSSNFTDRGPQFIKSTQTTLDSQENALMEELTALQSDFDTLRVSYSNTTTALNEAIFKKQELEREHNEIKIAFMGLQDENKKLLQEQEHLHKDIIGMRESFKNPNVQAHSHPLDIRDLSPRHSVYDSVNQFPPISESVSKGMDIFINTFTKSTLTSQELKKIISEGAVPVSECLRWLKSVRSKHEYSPTRSFYNHTNASIVAINSSIADSSIFRPEPASFGLSPENMVRATTSVARSPKPKDTPARKYGSTTTGPQARKSEVSPRPRTITASNLSRSQRTKDIA